MRVTYLTDKLNLKADRLPAFPAFPAFLASPAFHPRPSASIRGFIICLFCLTPAAHADSIRLLDQAGSAGPTITLAQVAELEGDYAASLGELIVGEFADSHAELTVQLATVRRVLTEARTNWADLTLGGPTQCVVSRTGLGRDDRRGFDAANDRAVTTSQELAIDHPDAGLSVGDLVTAELVRINGVPREQLEITFRGEAEGRTSLGVAEYSGGGVGGAAWLNRSAAVGRYELEPQGVSGLGRVTIKVRRYDPAGLIEEADITAEVARLTRAVVALRSIRRGELFNSYNVGVQEVRLTGEHGETLENVDLVLGQAAGASLRQGTVVLADHVAPDVLVRRGEVITVACVAGSLVVRTVGRAAENGTLGDIISVRNEATRETYFATVSGHRQARIESTPSESLASTQEPR